MSDRDDHLQTSKNAELTLCAGITVLVCNLLLGAITLAFNTQSQPSGGQPRHPFDSQPHVCELRNSGWCSNS